MPTDAAEQESIYLSAQLANYVYARRVEDLPDGWSPSTELSEKLRTSLALPPEGTVDNGYGTIADLSSGLTATVLVNSRAKEVVVAFGGTFSGPVAGSVGELVLGNLINSFTQWHANITAGFGGCPKSYEQADQLTKALSGMLEGTNFKLRLVGHSKGGGEATYAALAQPSPLNADVFGTSHLSLGLIERLPAENVRHAPQLVRSYSVSTDPVAHLREVPLLGIRGLGTDHFFPPHAPTGRSPLNVHVHFLDHLREFFTASRLETASRAGSRQ